MPKVAIVLFNLGGPDSTEAIRPFLLNFFSDPNIIRTPAPVRWVIARLIAWRRSQKEAGTSYGMLGGRSPLLENTQIQGQSLQFHLEITQPQIEFKTFVSMRYWHPMADETVAEVKKFAPDEIVLLPLYPQYSTTTTRSSLQEWQKACKAQGVTAPSSMICCYPLGGGFVQASADLIKARYADALQATKGVAPRVLFSAHGLPEAIIDEGDPYQWQCEQSATAIAAATGIADLDWQICYQSRVGRLKWIGPSTEEALHKAAKDKMPVLVYPHAFVSEHVETLVEIEHEYRDVADKLGISWFGRVPTVSETDVFIQSLGAMVMESLGSNRITSDRKQRLCPNEFSQCCQQEFAGKV